MKSSLTFATAAAVVAYCSGSVALAKCHPGGGHHYSPNAQQLLDESMEWMDRYYDSEFGYLYDFGGASALRHETRSSVWYSLGLLARNGKGDAEEAEKILSLVVDAQYKNVSAQWYGDYQVYPEEPELATDTYPAVIYNSWDPNWRGFIGTVMVIILEEFSGLLKNETQDLLVASLYNTTIGDTYRVGGVDDDNLYPAYSNPSIMRAFVSGWVGRRVNDQNMTDAGEMYAQEIIDLFSMSNTLSEFNSGTYTGVSTFGLTLWAKYLPKTSIMGQKGPEMLLETWKAVAKLWHPEMKNMAGPWDRSYGYDMNRYLSIMALWFWTIIGKENSSLIKRPELMSHSADFAFAPMVVVLTDFLESFLPKDLKKSLTTFDVEERTFDAQAFYPPYDTMPRNISTWLSHNLTIGAESFNQTDLGGPARSQEAFNPVVAQWKVGSEIAFLSLYPTEKALQAKVSPGKVSISYPRGTSSSIFSLMVSTFSTQRTVKTLEDIQGLDLTVTGNVDLDYTLTFAGQYGGSSKRLRDFELWNFTYVMPADFVGTPELNLEFALW
ncbi:uncharacterized protein B0I36DRAFT_88856 [Microdochium trichocladiopsis]|uniref:Uncharacterized protein n=1 Tax=Microdochium trichocladiopsis TaxID=1682393 RepID=A0A9P8YB55_9PEZI|nr:uncharacterized protein B0I36DRAFT_88856 [Microdochium trichocladiopsis]KAH7035151.1 hypothetical protein B0I36DRAFT_88856 [Microdochium trichocladiopsis]